MSEDFFPQGVASGSAFLGREQESKMLMANIQLGHHTLLMAPRRFGKTSLARHVLSKLKLPYEEINFYLARSTHSVEKKIRECIQTVLSEKIGKPELIFNSLKRFFMHSKKSWSFGLKGFASVELTPESEDTVTDNIFTELCLLDEIMKTHKKKVVLFLDEVQEIDLLPEGKQIQGAIREFAQQSKCIVFIFSGSNRRLLQHMFDDYSMPLYELCERIPLEKISETIYKNYLNKVSLNTHKKKLPSDVFQAILNYSDRHPKRIYNLCHQLWLIHPKKSFSKDAVGQCWNDFVRMRLNDTRVRLSKLNASQLKILTLIAADFSEPISGKKAQFKLDLASSTITKALKELEDEALINRNENRDGKNNYTVVDPLFKSVLSKYEHQNID